MARLHSRIYLHFLAVLVVVGLATSLVFALGTRGAFQRDVVERMVRHVASLAAERFDDRAALGERLRQIRADLAVDVTVRAPDGRVVAAAGPELPPLARYEAAELSARGIVARPRPRWTAATLVRDPTSGKVLGTIQAAADRRLGWAAFLQPALIVTLVLVLVAAATRPLARRISRPLERLTDAARRIGAGDLAARAPVPPVGRWRRRARAPEELTQLTGAFNDMAGRVERMVQSQRELLANVSHELRSPLARIRVALELLPRSPEAEARIRDVERDLAELERLIEDVLTAARLDATGLPAHLAPVDAHALLADIVERARLDPVTAGHEVRVADGAPVSVTADEALLRRAVWNLVENAAKYGAPPITLSATRDGGQVAISVEDEGPGIAAAERERVLDPFHRGAAARAARAAGDTGGVGLGLTLARRVAEAHGGAIVIGSARRDSAGERGCRVTIRLPMERGSSAA
jgi:signal transduction histidine kinase